MTSFTLTHPGSNGNGNVDHSAAGNGNHSDRQHPISVMLVDDEPTFLRIATLYLKTHYADQLDIVGTATSGEECLTKAQLLAPQVVLLDLNMPGLNGLQTIPLLRILFPETRIIALTLDDSETCRNAVLVAGGNGLVSKAAMSTLMPAIQSVMENEEEELELVAA